MFQIIHEKNKETCHNFNSISNSNCGRLNSNSNSNYGEYQFQSQLQLWKFHLHLQVKLRQVSWISTSTLTPEASTANPSPELTPALFTYQHTLCHTTRARKTSWDGAESETPICLLQVSQHQQCIIHTERIQMDLSWFMMITHSLVAVQPDRYFIPALVVTQSS